MKGVSKTFMEKTKNLVAFGEIQKNFKSILDLSLINTLEKLGAKLTKWKG